jgi:TolB-like protein
MDFGLAKMMARDSGTGWKEDSLATIVNFGTAVGTLSYMSPEQARCEEVDHRTDIFSLGAFIYEAITGQSAFSGESPAVVFEAILDRTPHLPSRLRPEVSSELDRIVNRCLEKDRELRYQTSADVRSELKKIQSDSSPDRFNLTLAGLPGRDALHSIVVLPLRNASHDPEEEYFADGMTEILISELGKIRALRVISCTTAMQYKGGRKTAPEIGRELNVALLVEGSILREKRKVRINVELINTHTDRLIWTESYQGDLRGIIGLQREVARSISREIHVQLTPHEHARLASARQVSPAVQEAYRKGRFHLNQRTENGLRKAIKYFEQAVEQDADFVQGYCGLADSFAMLHSFGCLPASQAAPRASEAAQ